MQQLPIRASDEVVAAIAAIGRTEDVHFSPSNTRLAVAGFKENSILVLTVTMTPAEVRIDSALTLASRAFSYPHGVFWLDETRLAVANRGGEITFVDVPDRVNTSAAEVPAVLTLRADDTDLLRAPGSIAIYPLGKGLVELLVCNNSSHYLTRHLLHQGNGLSVLSSEIVAQAGLSIPDGVTYDRDRQWAAVSNHNDHSVYIYRVADLGRIDRPTAILRGMSYPHGLRFSANAEFLFVADAGERFVHIHQRPGPDWSGDLSPVASIPVVDEPTFLRGRENEQEGGPKGVDLTADGTILVCSCHQQPLAFFAVEDLLGSLPKTSDAAGGATDEHEPDPILIDWLRAAREEQGALRSRLTATEATLATAAEELNMLRHRVATMTSSTSWRLTAPIRAARRLFGRAR